MELMFYIKLLTVSKKFIIYSEANKGVFGFRQLFFQKKN